MSEPWTLEGKVALITGASRGIGKVIAVRLARAGVHVIAAAKTSEPRTDLPGTIHETATECSALGPAAVPVQMNVREDEQVAAGVAAAVERFGRLDIAIHNAGALWWKPILETPTRKLDLVMDVNTRGAFALAHHTLPHIIAAGGGHFLTMSPPVDLDALPGKVGYLISKFGMTMTALGVAAEHAADGVAGNALWPETLIESAATQNFGLGGPAQWYKAELVADATHALLARDPRECTGRARLVMEVLREAGVTDLKPYRCDPESEPPILTARALPRAGGNERADGLERR